MKVVAPAVLAGRYEMGPVLGRGGMGEVHRAYDKRLGRHVAIKVFPQLETERDRARFEAEARAAAAISHPNVVAVHDVGVEPLPFLVMEFLPGGTLADELRAGALPVARVVAFGSEVLAGLGAAHDRGVIHRDLKPANVLFTSDRHAKLGDFGIAISLDAVTLTDTGIIIGTPAYVAPERLEGEPATVQTDLYSVGVMLYEALAGTRPFSGDSPLAVAYAAHHRDPRPLHEVADVPDRLSDVVMRAMARSAARRYQSAEELSHELQSTEVTAPPTSERSRIDADAETDTVAVGTVAPYEPTSRLPIAASPGATTPTPVTPKKRPRHRYLRGSLLGVAALVALLWGAYAASRDTPARDQRSPTTNAPTTIPLPAPLRAPFDELDKALNP